MGNDEGMWHGTLQPRFSNWISDLARSQFWVWQACFMVTVRSVSPLCVKWVK